MATAHVQSKSVATGANSSSASVTLTGVAAGNHVSAFTEGYGVGGDPVLNLATSPSGTFVNGLPATLNNPTGTDEQGIRADYSENAASGSWTVTFHAGKVGGAYIEGECSESSGVATSSSLGATNHNASNQTAVGSETTGSITPASGSILYVLTTDNGGTQTPDSIDNSFSMSGFDAGEASGGAGTVWDGGNDNAAGHAYKANVAASAINPTFTLPSGTAVMLCGIIEFKAPAAGGPSPGSDTVTLGEGPIGIGLSNADAVTLADAFANALAASNSGTIADTAAIALVAQDSLAFAETAAIAIASSSSDATTLGDLAAIAIAASDSGSVGNSALISIPVTGADAITLSETVSIAVAATGQDTLTVAELVAVVSATASTDSAAIAEAASIAVASADTATLAEQIALALQLADSASLAEQMAMALVLSDQATLADAVSVAVAVAAAQEALTLGEQASVSAGGASTPVAASDSGAVVEAARIIDTLMTGGSAVFIFDLLPGRTVTTQDLRYQVGSASTTLAPPLAGSARSN